MVSRFYRALVRRNLSFFWEISELWPLFSAAFCLSQTENLKRNFGKARQCNRTFFERKQFSSMKFPFYLVLRHCHLLSCSPITLFEDSTHCFLFFCCCSTNVSAGHACCLPLGACVCVKSPKSYSQFDKQRRAKPNCRVHVSIFFFSHRHTLAYLKSLIGFMLAFGAGDPDRSSYSVQRLSLPPYDAKCAKNRDRK